KYLLAITDALIDLYGQDIGVGYDVGCTFNKIVQDSPLLGAKAHNARIKFCVNAFHGYAHNCLCQVQHHPLYLSSFGLEDLKTMKHIFSASNGISYTMCYATQYHWTQALDLHFQQWDNDNYQESSNFFFFSFHQLLAWGLIHEYTDAVASLLSSLGLAEDDFEHWVDEEHQFLMDLKEKPSDHGLSCSYVQALIDQDNAKQAAHFLFFAGSLMSLQPEMGMNI
ncbi:hypothetical protein DFH29DRAFT_800494, partial [Suillus ampliporus]